MKKIQIALFALAMAAVPAGAHVFDDAVFYFNGGSDFSCFAFHLVEFEAPPDGTLLIIR